MDNQLQGSVGVQTQRTVEPPIKVKYVLYARKSTESEEKQILSIDSQVKEMLQIAEREGLEIIDIRRESHSAKDSGERPVFNEIVKDLKAARFNGILTWAPDRLSRNAGDLGSLVDLMDQKLLVEIKTYGQRFTNSPSEKFLLMILCSQAKLENDNKSVNVKRGLRMRCEMGLWPAPAPTGYLNEKRIDRKCHVIVDPRRASVIKQMFEKLAYEHWSGRKIYHWLKFDLNFRTAAGNKNLTLSNVYRILQMTFYYGTFEYPIGSGNWYAGKHKPLITRELFDRAQEQLKRDQIIRSETKEFSFTKMLICGLCGSGITAQEKYKKQKNGNVHKYVYYGCTRSRDRNCKSKYMREEEIIDQLLKLVDRLDVDELSIRNKFQEELGRIRKFQRMFLGMKSVVNDQDFEIKLYIKYLLKEGSVEERREFLGIFKNKITIENKILRLI